jgi:precorrin-2/cobalt-factor-2 C20-methyltransferase
VAAYQNFANQIKEYLNKQVDVGVLCEGDPLFFGSFITIRDLLKESHQVKVVSGISSIMSAFVHLDDFMGQGDDSISIITAGTDEFLIRDKISKSNTTIIIKVAKHLKKIKKIATDLGLLETSMYISQIDQAHQYSDRLSMISDEVIEYFSIIIIKNHKLN